MSTVEKVLFLIAVLLMGVAQYCQLTGLYVFSIKQWFIFLVVYVALFMPSMIRLYFWFKKLNPPE